MVQRLDMRDAENVTQQLPAGQTGMSFCAAKASAKVECKEGVFNGKGRGGGDVAEGQTGGVKAPKQKHRSLPSETQQKTGSTTESDSEDEEEKVGKAKSGGGAKEQAEEESIAEKKKCVDDHVRQICKQLPEGGLAIVLGTSADLSDVTHLRLRRRNAAGNVSASASANECSSCVGIEAG